MEEARSHQSVDWLTYFKSIQTQCPWSLVAWIKGKIDVVRYEGRKLPLMEYRARMYLINAEPAVIESICSALDYDDKEYEWLFSYPSYGEYATPVPVIIQQRRAELNMLRQQINAGSDEETQ